MASKKGVIEIQFNWVLILIAGAAILIAFTGIVIKHKNISEDSADILEIRNLDSILSSSEANSGTAAAIKIPKAKIRFSCDGYSIGKASRKIKAISVFMPSTLEGDSMIYTALGWDMPYRITNFVYLTNSGVRYVFIGDSDFARKIYLMMPSSTNNEGYTDSEAIQDYGDNRIRLIFFNQNPKVPENLKGSKDGEITALKITGDEKYGTLEFFYLSEGALKPEGASYYLSEPMLFGAIFTDNAETYGCVMKNAFDKLNIISKIYENKVDKTAGRYSSMTGDACKQFYADSAQYILDDLRVLSSSAFPRENFYEIANAANEIERKNDEAASQSCITIY